MTTFSEYWRSPLVLPAALSIVSLFFLYHASTKRLKLNDESSSNSSQSVHKSKSKSKHKNSSSIISSETEHHESNMNCRYREEVLKKWMDLWVTGGSFPGLMVSIIKDEKEIFHHRVGYANVKENKHITRDTLFRIYSMSKPITAIAALILVDRGQLQLDDPVCKYIPSFANQKVLAGGTPEEPILEDLETPITIRHLLTHTSGICYGIFGNSAPDICLRNSFPSDSCKVWFSNQTSEQVCERIASAPLAFQPGKAFLYGLNTDVLGRIVEIISNQSLREFFIKEIFQPLEMNDTDFYIKDPSALDRLAECYEVIPGNQFAPSVNPERRRDREPVFQSGGGGLVSTLDDYLKFSKFILRKFKLSNGKSLLSEALYEAMMSNQLPGGKDLVELATDNAFSESIGEGVGHGLGLSVLIQPTKCKGAHLSNVGEAGWGGVGSTWFVVDPSSNSAIVLMASLIPSSAYPIRSQLRTLFHWVAHCKDSDPIVRLDQQSS